MAGLEPDEAIPQSWRRRLKRLNDNIRQDMRNVAREEGTSRGQRGGGVSLVVEQQLRTISHAFVNFVDSYRAAHNQPPLDAVAEEAMDVEEESDDGRE